MESVPDPLFSLTPFSRRMTPWRAALFLRPPMLFALDRTMPGGDDCTKIGNRSNSSLGALAAFGVRSDRPLESST